MKRISVSEVLARANATMVNADCDVTGALASLLTGAIQALPADAAAVLVEVDGTVELLSATSHRVADLQVAQALVDEGPCLDAIRRAESVSVSGSAALIERWPTAGRVIVGSGYSAVQATPLTWQGTVFGGLNLFRLDATDLNSQHAECRALADAVTLIIASGNLSRENLADGVRAALEDRAVVEQAKGALAHLRSVAVSAAYDELVRLAEGEGLSLGAAARLVMTRARSGTLD